MATQQELMNRSNTPVKTFVSRRYRYWGGILFVFLAITCLIAGILIVGSQTGFGVILLSLFLISAIFAINFFTIGKLTVYENYLTYSHGIFLPRTIINREEIDSVSLVRASTAVIVPFVLALIICSDGKRCRLESLRAIPKKGKQLLPQEIIDFIQSWKTQA